MNRFARTALAAATLATALSACSTRPRNFAAQVSTPVADRIAFENDYRTCTQLVTSGHSGHFKAAAATGLAGAAGTVGTTAVFATAGGIGIGGATTAASIAIPGVGLLAAFGVNRAIRGGKERKFKRNMTACLNEYGYEVADWDKLNKRDDSAAFAAKLASERENDAPTEPAMQIKDIPAGEVPQEIAIIEQVD